MLNDSIYWDVAYANMNAIFCEAYGFQGSGPYRYCIDGDTTINGTVYKTFKSYSFFTLLQQPSPNCPPFAIDTVPSTGWNAYSFLREDTLNMKIYKYSVPDSTEYLWYDFAAQIGDTLIYPNFGYFIIDTVYNVVTLDGVTRKFFSCNGNQPLCAYYIEGLGGKAGPFHEPYDVFEFGPWIMCISDLNQNAIYTPINSNCYNFTTGINMLMYGESQISIFPNPAQDFLNVNNLSDFEQILVYDPFGKTVLIFDKIEGMKIPISALKVGIYSICIKKDNREYYVDKFIKM